MAFEGSVIWWENKKGTKKNCLLITFLTYLIVWQWFFSYLLNTDSNQPQNLLTIFTIEEVFSYIYKIQTNMQDCHLGKVLTSIKVETNSYWMEKEPDLV